MSGIDSADKKRVSTATLVLVNDQTVEGKDRRPPDHGDGRVPQTAPLLRGLGWDDSDLGDNGDPGYTARRGCRLRSRTWTSKVERCVASSWLRNGIT